MVSFEDNLVVYPSDIFQGDHIPVEFSAFFQRNVQLGHLSLKTTEIYLKSLPTSILDDYNEKIMQGA